MKAKNYKSRHLQKKLLAYSQDDSKIILITGARQTGKTTIAKNCFARLKYFNLDAPEIREKITKVKTFDWPRDVGEAILDEVQKEPVALEKIKYCYDEGSLIFSVILGSSQLMLLKKVRESLAGRVTLFELFPFMLSELIEQQELKAPLIDKLLAGTSVCEVLKSEAGVLFGADEERKKHAFEYLSSWGGMPSLFGQNLPEEKKKWLKDYEYTYLERDLVDLARLNDLEPFRKFQTLAALRSAKLLSYSELARDGAISVDTSRRYFEYLRISYQSFFLNPYYKNDTTSLVKTPKVYWMDIGLLRQAMNYWGPPTGELFETLVVSEIYKWIKTSERDASMYFYRTHGGQECDLILKTPKGLIGVEIKMRDRVYSKDITPLKEISKKFPGEWLGSLVVYNGLSIEKLKGEKCWAIPAWRLLS